MGETSAVTSGDQSLTSAACLREREHRHSLLALGEKNGDNDLREKRKRKGEEGRKRCVCVWVSNHEMSKRHMGVYVQSGRCCADHNEERHVKGQRYG